MHFINILFLLPLAQATTYYIEGGLCSNKHTCEVHKEYDDPASLCNGRAGHYAGTGNNGRESCTPPNTRCTYTWEC
ncbi:hypothetical protein M3J09_006146 [Ascochyta lentis]